MGIDIEIRHVTKRDANLFEELGFSGREAERLRSALQRQIYGMNLLSINRPVVTSSIDKNRRDSGGGFGEDKVNGIA